MKKQIDPNNYEELNDKYESFSRELYSYLKKKGKHKRAEKNLKN